MGKIGLTFRIKNKKEEVVMRKKTNKKRKQSGVKDRKEKEKKWY